MDAREMFKVGQRVAMTREAIESGLDGLHKRRIGTVKGFSRDGQYVRVLRDGDHYKNASAYSVNFWTVIDDDYAASER